MAVVKFAVIVPVRAFLWLRYLAGKESPAKYVRDVVLRHLFTTPGVDLSRSPFFDTKGGDDGSEDIQTGSGDETTKY
jgi:hypothetical protein